MQHSGGSRRPEGLGRQERFDGAPPVRGPTAKRLLAAITRSKWNWREQASTRCPEGGHTGDHPADGPRLVQPPVLCGDEAGADCDGPTAAAGPVSWLRVSDLALPTLSPCRCKVRGRCKRSGRSMRPAAENGRVLLLSTDPRLIRRAFIHCFDLVRDAHNRLPRSCLETPLRPWHYQRCPTRQLLPVLLRLASQLPHSALRPAAGQPRRDTT